jgi:S-adenosylmethionine synthetase
MKEKSILTAESVTEGHLDKLCDQIADAVLDECLRNDPNARVACEVMATYGKVIVAGEITATIMPDIPYIVCRTIRHIGYENDYEVEVITHDQSADIAGAVKSCSGNKSLSLYVDPLDGRLVENCSGNSISHPGSDTLGAGDQGVMYGTPARKRMNCCRCSWLWRIE